MNKIRIIDGNYNDICKMNEGDELVVEKDGNVVSYGHLEYIDSTHFGTDKGHIFHIAQFGQYVLGEGYKLKGDDVQ